VTRKTVLYFVCAAAALVLALMIRCYAISPAAPGASVGR